ncbi:exodeoxyribonuclease III [Lysinibacillus sp. 2017]|uniref:exodeoxyribonuclease III n=1 Tax=unclassified Lysinibacillus TaxID=2636778 RepID=UPI000D525CB8|nr:MULTISPECIES: exodeoxyribonuclease III [unclassified Lysinibacillus]AWE08944.1 exodeoxyribonuclease III [Lysinibacillus sp. 2017]TGN35546.1 exodeoxyribonuclease III [Lysinibacillus sp. S2017]
MKFISWNVNGIRACVNKGFLDYFHQIDADFFCIQETKCQTGQIDLQLDGYYQYWNDAVKKGYSGTAIFTKHEPLSVRYGIDEEVAKDEGRIITLEYEKFYLVNVYTPNAKRDLTRLAERLLWENRMRQYLVALDAEKPVIYCGDLNVAHEELDLKNAKSNKGNSGFTAEERGKMTDLLVSGFTDTFRYTHVGETDHFTWWSYMNKVRERNIGWRIDYFIMSNRLLDHLEQAAIHANVLGSDHCPIELELTSL